MDRPKEHPPHSRAETAAPSSASFAMKRGGPRDAAGGGGNDTDAVTRCPRSTWEMAHFPLTCVICGLHVRLHGMEIVTRRIAPRMRRYGAGCSPAGELVPRSETGRKQVPNRCPEPLAGDGRATMPQRSMRSAESESPQPPRWGSSDAAFPDKPAYPPWPHSVCLPEGLAGGYAPSDPQHPNGAL